MRKNIPISATYCTLCGNRGIPIPRPKRARSGGHLKKLWCISCNKETNHCEIPQVGNYNLENFLFEFNNHNFDSEGNRILSYGELKNKIYKECDSNEND